MQAYSVHRWVLEGLKTIHYLNSGCLEVSQAFLMGFLEGFLKV